MLFQTILVVISSLLLFSIVSGKMQKTLRKVPQLARFFSTSSTPGQGNVSSATSTNLQKKASDYFKEKDENKLFDLIEKYSFGILIMTNDDGTIQISHVPMYLDRKTRTLNGHLANHNPMYSLISQGKPITIVFEGPHSYISPTFMADKYNRVPTWNYCYAHVHGTSELISAEELPQGLAILGRKYEGDSESAWKMKEMDLKILKPKFHKIFGIRVKIDRVEGNFKFTADADEDKAGILKGLRDRNEDYDRSLADLMAKAWETETKTE